MISPLQLLFLAVLQALIPHSCGQLHPVLSCTYQDYLNASAPSECAAVIAGANVSLTDSFIVTPDLACNPICTNFTVEFVQNECSETDFGEFIGLLCEVNVNNALCNDVLVGTSLIEDANVAAVRCFPFMSNSMCSNECRGNLTSLQETYGCCFNNILNNSFFISTNQAVVGFIVSFELWSACETDLPGFCTREETTSTPPPTSNPTTQPTSASATVSNTESTTCDAALPLSFSSVLVASLLVLLPSLLTP